MAASKRKRVSGRAALAEKEEETKNIQGRSPKVGEES
jgi:hypothetical protein